MESYPGLHGRYLQRRLADSMAIRQILCASLPQNRLPAWRILLVEQTFLSAGQGRPGEGRLITLAKRPKEEGSRQTPLML